MNTIGERRIGITIAELSNTEDNIVNKIKIKTAELINLIEEQRKEDSSSEKHRLLSIAQTEIETASMYAVKACFRD